jgi:hypothetical protein
MTTLRRHLALMALGLLAVGCSKTSSSSGGNDGNSGSSGIAVPKEISALPTKSSSASSLHAQGNSSSLVSKLSQALATDTDTDYTNAQTVKFVDERALSQFDILNTIFNALGQTHYADAENIGKGPYGSMVSWVEERGDGQNSKKLVPWVVDSSMITEDGKDVNRVLVWMLETEGDGQPRLIKVEVKIYEAPVQNADGSYADYGVWTINAALGGPPSGPGAPGPGPGPDDSSQAFFTATAAHGQDGLSVVMVHDKEGPGRETRGIMQRSDTHGSGKVNFPDWSSCHEEQCQPQPVTVAYVYNAEHVALKKGEKVVYKDRTSVVDLVHRYGLYDAETGADVAKGHSFGFPVRFTDDQGRQRHGYYGAWQGRHQLWSDGQQTIPTGTAVTRADRPPSQAAETFTASAPFKGTLVKRTMVAADIQDIKNLVVETWVNQGMSLRWNEGQQQWINCIQPAMPIWPPSCAEGSAPFDIATLTANPLDHRRNININFWDIEHQEPVNLIYDPAGVSGPGLYKVTWNTPPTPPENTGILWTPANDDQLWVNINGSIYISFDGSSWVQKKVISFDEQMHAPTFDPAGDVDYALELDREYYINNQGGNYIVKRTGAGAYDVHIELQSVANPVNALAFVTAGTEFRPQWGGIGTTYEFVTTSTSDKYLKLVYKTVDTNDKTEGATPGAIVEQGQWGLVAWVNGANTGVQYNWDYPRVGEDWGSQQFLKNADGTFKLLDNPIRLAPIPLVNGTGASKTLSLQFDGSWVGGLPDVYNDLQKNDWVITKDIADKIVVIPAGTEVVDAEDPAKHYLFKPLQMNEYLRVITEAPELDLSAAEALNLQLVPNFVPHNMGALPDVPVKYSEGKLLQ